MSVGDKDLKDKDRSTQMAEVLRLSLMEGKGIRAIERQTGLDRRKVRDFLSSVSGARRPARLNRPAASEYMVAICC